jgi:iron(III) transport system substrate-binding protein
VNRLSKALYFLPLVLPILLLGCQPPSEVRDMVVVYTSVDQPFSEPILEEYERATGVEVQAVYDVEAAKTTGLVNRLIAEAAYPKADVFWNSEIIQTISLKQKGVLAPYLSPQAGDIPATYRDPDNYWTGLSPRARVIIVNTERVPSPETVNSIYDFLDPNWQGEDLAIAYPLFGTTATHAAALYATLGETEARDYFKNLAARGVRAVDGNSVVRDMAANGSLAFGLTDTDDACTSLAQGAPVAVILPDQEDLGTLLIPNTIALIAKAPHPEQGQALIDYLLSAEVEQALIDSGYSHIPLYTTTETRQACIPVNELRGMEVDYAEVYTYLDVVQSELREIFLR